MGEFLPVTPNQARSPRSPPEARPKECPHLTLGFHAVHPVGGQCIFDGVA